MRIPTWFRPSAAALAAALVTAVPAAQALDIQFRDAAGASALSTEQRAAFQTAADFWASRLADPVTVYLDVGSARLAPGQLVQNQIVLQSLSYTNTAALLAGDARSASDAAAVAHLQPGASLAFQASLIDGGTRYDDDQGQFGNNDFITLTAANYRALGGVDVGPAGGTDATILFASGLSGSSVDLVTLASREIARALGFMSGVDDIDAIMATPGPDHDMWTQDDFEIWNWYTPLDLFRYSRPGLMDVSVGTPAYFSLDGGATSLQAFSTGAHLGNGQAAGSWDAADLLGWGIGAGQSFGASALDLTAMDVIGWDLAAAVPEPGSLALLLAGLGVVGTARRRRPS